MGITMAREVSACLTKAPSRTLRWSALALAIASAHGIYAQSPDMQPAGAGEEIVVMGSRIR